MVTPILTRFSCPFFNDDEEKDPAAASFDISEIAIHPRLWRSMPVDLWPSWQDACRPFFRAYHAASTSGSLNSMFGALLALMKLPASSLLRTRGGRKKRRGIRSLLANLRNTAARSVSAVASHQSQPVAASDDVDPVANGLARARALIQQGHVGRAARSLFQKPLPSVDGKVIEDLAKLHPAASGPVPPLPADAPMIQQIDLAVLSRLVRTSLANGSAPGGSGWTGDLILALIDDHDCLTALGVLVKDILNGTLTGKARELLVSSILFAGKKASGGSRPIAMGEAFYKLACLYALDLVYDRVRTALGPIQFAFSPGGPESALNILQSTIEVHPDWVIISTDLQCL